MKRRERAGAPAERRVGYDRPMVLTVSGFSLGEPIPVRHTGLGDDRSPPLAWSEVPAGTRSFALVLDDPDAPRGPWVHWLAWGFPATARGLAEGVGAEAPGLVQGTNSFGTRGYRGPFPPAGAGAHRYVVRVYALSNPVALAPGATRPELELALRGRVIASAEVMGKFWRER